MFNSTSAILISHVAPNVRGSVRCTEDLMKWNVTALWRACAGYRCDMNVTPQCIGPYNPGDRQQPRLCEEDCRWICTSICTGTDLCWPETQIQFKRGKSSRGLVVLGHSEANRHLNNNNLRLNNNLRKKMPLCCCVIIGATTTSRRTAIISISKCKIYITLSVNMVIILKWRNEKVSVVNLFSSRSFSIKMKTAFYC